MGSLPNNFAFSFSKFKTWKTCRRAWWLSSVAHWNGWDRGAPDIVKLAYRLTKMSSFYRLAGEQVHQVLHEGLINPQITLEQAEAHYTQAMRAAYQQSRDSEWANDPKRKCNLSEHYYGNPDEKWSDGDAKKAFDRGLAALRNAFAMPELSLARTGQLVEAEALKQMDVGGVPVWVKLDAAFRDRGVLRIYDWKTGRQRAEDGVQAMVYSLYATKALRDEDVVVYMIYLGEQRVVEHRVIQSDLETLEAAILAGATEIQSLLPNPAKNDAPVTNFPRTTDLSTCQRCDFFHACKGHRDPIGNPGRVADGWDEKLAALPWAPGGRR